MDTAAEIEKIAFLGDYLPHKYGIATFTSDLRAAVAANQPRAECFSFTQYAIRNTLPPAQPSPCAFPSPALHSVAMFDTIAAELTTATDKLTHLRRFL
jgi:hypothetical protein